MKFIVFYLEFINSLEGPGMFFSSAAIIRRLRSYAATIIFWHFVRLLETMDLFSQNDSPNITSAETVFPTSHFLKRLSLKNQLILLHRMPNAEFFSWLMYFK